MSKYTDSVERNLKGMDAVSTGVCPGCAECQDDFGFESQEDFEAAWSSGEVFSEPGFSWASCGICGSRLGGDREVWHWADGNGEIIHETDACVDCVVYLANGDEPESWKG